MYGKWIKCYFILAILIMSLVSLSTAACPWYIKNDLYTAECGVLKEVPADSGILANDPIGTTVIDPESITIDPKYGTLSVKADGSFVYDPSPNIQSGTYVIFKYRATNGVCEAKYLGTAKIQVFCKCRPHVVDVTLCMPQSIDDVKAGLIAAGVGCWGCGDTTPVFDLSQVKLIPGTYPYLLKCPACVAATGLVTIISECRASAPDITICEGTLKADIDYSAATCSGEGCDMQPRIDDSLVTTDVNGFVTGGTYRAICGEGTECESSATGNIIVLQMCDVLAPDIEICEGEVDLTELTAMIYANAGCSGEGCVMDVDTSAVTVVDGIVTGGFYEVCCTVTGPMGTVCTSCARGNIIVIQKCDVLAPDIEICEREVDLAELTAMIYANAGCSGEGCVMDVDTSGVTVVDGIVTGGFYEVCCTITGPMGTVCTACDRGDVIVIPKCSVEALEIEICEGQETLETLLVLARSAARCGDNCPDSVPEIDLSTVTLDDEGYVNGGYYTATCTVPGTECESSASADIVLKPPEACLISCPCVAVAPPIEVCAGEVTLDELEDMIDAVADCQNDASGIPCDATPTIDTSDVAVSNGFVTGGTYKVTCIPEDCIAIDQNVATGTITTKPCCTCQAIAPDVCVCTDASLQDIEDEIYAAGLECSGCIDVDPVLVLDGVIPGTAGDYQYTVKCDEGAPCPVSDATGYVHIKDKVSAYKLDPVSYPIYMDQNTYVGDATVEIDGDDLVITVSTNPGNPVDESSFKVQTSPITDCSTGGWDHSGTGNLVVYTIALADISGLSCTSTLYIGIHVNTPNTAWADGGCDLSCTSGRWAYGICAHPTCEETCPCDS